MKSRLKAAFVSNGLKSLSEIIIREGEQKYKMDTIQIYETHQMMQRRCLSEGMPAASLLVKTS